MITLNPSDIASTLNYLGKSQFNDPLFAGSITGPGSLAKSGIGTLTMINTGTNSYTGETTITAGTVQISNGGTSGSLGFGNVVNSAQLVFNRSDAITQGLDFGSISGSGKIVVQGGTIVMSAVNTYTGGTTINAGNLQIGNGGARESIGTGAVVNNARLAFNRTGATQGLDFGTISGSGQVILQGARRS